jgi:hypothetical protein
MGFLDDKAAVVGKAYFPECLGFPLPVNIPTLLQTYLHFFSVKFTESFQSPQQ